MCSMINVELWVGASNVTVLSSMREQRATSGAGEVEQQDLMETPIRIDKNET